MDPQTKSQSIANSDLIEQKQTQHLEMDIISQDQHTKSQNINNQFTPQDFFSKLDFDDINFDQLPSPPKLDKSPYQSFQQQSALCQKQQQQQTTNSFSNIQDLMSYLAQNMKSGQNTLQINGETLKLNFDTPSSTQCYNSNNHLLNHQIESQVTQETLNSSQSIKFKQFNMVSVEQQISDQKVDIKQTCQEAQAQQSTFKAQGIFQLQNINIDMKKIEALYQMDNDDLLILSDLDDSGTLETTNNQPQCSQTKTISDEKCSTTQSNCQNQTKTDQDSDKYLIVEAKSLQQQHKTSRKSDQAETESQLQLKRHNTERPLLSNFIVSQDYNRCLNFQPQNQIQTQTQVINTLKFQLHEKSSEVVKLKETISRISQCLAKIYSSPQLLQKDIDDTELIQMLSQGFLSQAKLHLAFLFSSPLIMKYKDDISGDLRSQTIQQIDHEKEFRGVMDSLSNTGNHIRYRKIPATLDNLRVSLTENPIALHFSGHGIENNKKNFGKDSLVLKDEGNFLIFEDNEGCAQFMSEKKLHELLEARGTQLEFVFVASCYSQFAGEIFHNAGAKHVICVQRGYQISDEASILFSKSFYHALFSQTVTVCQAFDLAKAALKADKNKALAAEARKFVILKDTDEKLCQSQNNQLTPLPLSFKPKKHKCTVFGPFMKGNIENVGQEPLFRLEQSKVEDFIGRGKEMQEIISDIFNNRFVTIKGIPGIGKTTIAKAIMHYLDERQTFKDGIIFLSLRSLDQANMILTRVQLLLQKHLPPQEKEEKALETFSTIQDRLIQFLKDKEVLFCLDNAEDTLRKEGNQFREILQNFLVRCNRLKVLLTSRYPIGQLADISEKIYTLKELPSHFAIELLIKKAMRPIEDLEIQDLLQSANPTRILHSNPVGLKKNIRRLDEHHICTLLGGHPHAISLAAPLLQDKSLKELYALLNSPEIIEWLQIEGIEGTPLASLKVSLDTSIQHMTDQEPLAIKLFCLIGLFPGGCTEEDLNALWKNGWVKLAEKLLRASLLVKKAGQNEEIRYTLFPFMNQYAVQLMDDEQRINEHKNVCIYLAKICRDLLKHSQSEIINRIVSFETNIWACIYRIIDRNPLSASEYSTRGKSPASNLRESQNHKQSQMEGGIVKSNYDSSQGDHSSDRQMDNQADDYYETILQQRRQGDQRSRSERLNMRSLINENQTHSSADQEEETKTIVSVESQSNNKSNDNLNQAYDDIQQSNVCDGIFRVRFSQPQNLLRSQYDDDNFSGSQPQSNDKDSNGYQNINDSEHFYPTKQMANQLSDDQISLFLSTHSQNSKIKEKLRILENQSNLKRVKTEDSIIIEEESKSGGVSLNQNELDSINRSSSNDFNHTVNTPSNQTLNVNLTQHSNNTNSHGKSHNHTHIMHEISYLKLQQLPTTTAHLPQDFDEEVNQSMIQYQNEMFETASMDSLQSQLINMNMTTAFGSDYTHSSIFCQQRRKSGMSKFNLQNLDLISETLDEDNSCIMMEEEENEEDQNDQYDDQSNEHDDQNILSAFKEQLEVEYTDQDKEPVLIKRLSSKKYQEDEVKHNQNLKFLQIPQQQVKQVETLSDNNEKNSGQEDNQKSGKKAKSKQKRVTIQEVEVEDKKSTNRQMYPQSINISQKQSKMQSSLLVLTPEGSLLVNYITNLVVLHKYDEALKTIENFGLKYTEDKLCLANLMKLQGFILSETNQDIKQVQQKYDQASKLFQFLKISHGQALCTCAIGFLMYSKPSMFINKKMNENKVFDQAMKKFSDGVQLYSKVNHLAGEAFCHKILSFIKKKLGENFMEHQRKQKMLMMRESQLQSEGRSQYINLYQGIQQESLFLEVIQQIQEQTLARESMIQIKNVANQKEPAHLSTSAKRVSKKDPLARQEENKPAAIIQNVKKSNISKPSELKITTGVNNASQQAMKNTSSINYNLEFDKLKFQLEHSKKQDSKIELDDPIPNISHKNEKPIEEGQKKRNQPPQVNKQFANTFSGSKSDKHLQISKIQNKNQEINSILSSDNENQQQPINQIMNLKTMLNAIQPVIKEEKKAVNLREQALQKIEQYKVNRFDQIEKAKTSQQSSFFVQPKNSIQCQERQSFIKSRNTMNPDTSQSLHQSMQNSKKQQVHQRKPGNDLFNSTQSNITINSVNQSNIFKPGENQNTNLLPQSDMIFDQANDMAFSMNDSEGEESLRPNSNRQSLVGTKSNESNSSNQLLQQKKTLAYNNQSKAFEKNHQILMQSQEKSQQSKLKKAGNQQASDNTGRLSVRNIRNNDLSSSQSSSIPKRSVHADPGRHQSPSIIQKKQQQQQHIQQQIQPQIQPTQSCQQLGGVTLQQQVLNQPSVQQQQLPQMQQTSEQQQQQPSTQQLPQPQLQQVCSQQVIKGLFGMSVTTTTTVRFEGMLLPIQQQQQQQQQLSQVVIDHQPEIIIEQVDDAIRNAVAQQQLVSSLQQVQVESQSNSSDSQLQSQSNSYNSSSTQVNQSMLPIISNNKDAVLNQAQQ